MKNLNSGLQQNNNFGNKQPLMTAGANILQSIPKHLPPTSLPRGVMKDGDDDEDEDASFHGEEYEDDDFDQEEEETFKVTFFK